MNKVTIKLKTKRTENKTCNLVVGCFSSNDWENNNPSISSSEGKKDSNGYREIEYDFDIEDETIFVENIKKSVLGKELIQIIIDYNVNVRHWKELIDEMFVKS